MRLKGQTVLVTGAGGFIGSHLVEQLVERGCRVRAMLHYDSRPGHGNLDLCDVSVRSSLEIIAGDVCDPHFVHTAMQGCSVVFHLAALIGVPYSYAAPGSYVATNVVGTLNVLEAARRHQIERVVHTSTSECYGTAQVTPIAESHRLQAQSPYAASKIGADALAQSYHLSFELPVCTLRPFNNYGPRQSPRAVIPEITAQLLWGGPELRLGATRPIRDFLYVTDTCEAFCRMVEVDDCVGQTLNVGTGRGVSIGEVATTLQAIVGTQKPVVCQSDRLRPEGSEVMELCCDASRAQSVLEWSPRVALEEGLARVVRFVERHPTLYRTAGDYPI